MTPKEKAEELVDKFYYIPNSQGIFMMQDYQAKQCALIAVDELIRNSFPVVIKCHWQEVKQEIELL